MRFAKLYAFDPSDKSAAEIEKQLAKANKFEGEEGEAWDALVLAEQQHLRARADVLQADARLARVRAPEHAKSLSVLGGSEKFCTLR